MRKLFGIFLLCALMSAHVCAATGSAHAAAALVSRGIDLAAKASDDFIPVVREEDYSLERLIRKHELTFGEKNNDGAALAGWLGIQRSWLCFDWFLPDAVSNVLTCYRTGQHWCKDTSGQVHADPEFLNEIAIKAKHNKSTILKRVIAQHIIDVCEQEKLTTDAVYGICQKVMTDTRVPDVDVLSIYKFFLKKELAAITHWVNSTLGYKDKDSVPEGLRTQYRSLSGLINEPTRKVDSYDVVTCKQKLVALENAKRHFCHVSQEVYTQLLGDGRIAKLDMRSAFIAGTHALVNAAGGFEKRYEEKAEELAAKWKLAHAERAATEGSGSIGDDGDASAGPVGAESGAGAAGAGGLLVRNDAVALSESSDLAPDKESLQALYDLLDVIQPSGSAHKFSIETDHELPAFLDNADLKNKVIVRMAEFLNQDDGKAWQFRDFLKRVTDERVKKYIGEVYTTADNALRVARRVVASEPHPASAAALEAAAGTPGAGPQGPRSEAPASSMASSGPAAVPASATGLEAATGNPGSAAVPEAVATEKGSTPRVPISAAVPAPATGLASAPVSPASSALVSDSGPTTSAAASIPATTRATELEIATGNPEVSASATVPETGPAAVPEAAETGPETGLETGSATPPAQSKNNSAANGILTLGGVLTAGSLGYLITELVKSKEVQVVVGRAFKKFLGKKVAPLTFRQRRIAQRLGLHGGVAGAGVIAGLVALIFGSRMRRV